MPTQQVSPLRIQKGNSATSPTKMPMATNRPLSELSPMAIRRNSPSFPQAKANLFKSDASPATSSPSSVNVTSSPRLFWQGRDPTSPSRENRNPQDTMLSQSPAKRSSIENLKKASRVKNSSMFALEQNHHYDPSRPNILDGRPASIAVQSPKFALRVSDAVRKENITLAPRQSTDMNSSQIENSFTTSNYIAPLSPSKQNTSPAKSSLSKKTGTKYRNGFDPDTGIWEDEDDEEKILPEGKGLHRHAKSVTFDQAPPQVNEYEMTTPDPSSVASGSREGSYDSFGEEDEDVSFERGSSIDHDDSFDASLEDTDKTPVVLPEDWRFMSPDIANTALAQHEEDVFDDDVGSPAPNANPGLHSYRDHQTSVTSVDSNGIPRPLPPLPSAIAAQLNHSPRKDSLSGTLERMSSAQRTLPSPPSAPMISKSDIRRMSGSDLPLKDRIRLMMMQEQEQTQTVPEMQRERRMRRAESKESTPARSVTNESDFSSPGEPGPEFVDATDGMQHISREAILRHMRSREFSERGDSEEYNPDVPIPSREDPTQTFDESVLVKDEETDQTDLYSIPQLYSKRSHAEYDTEDDLASQYSQMSLQQASETASEDGQETPRTQTPKPELEEKKASHERVSLPDFADFGNDSSFNFGLETYMTPPAEAKPVKETSPSQHAVILPDLAAVRDSIQRPYTPQEQLQPPAAVWNARSTSEEPGTPESVIRHPVRASSPPRDSFDSEASKEPEQPETQAKLTTPELRDPVKRNSLEEEDSADNDKPSRPTTEEPLASKSEDVVNEVTVTDKKRNSSFILLDLPSNNKEESLGFNLDTEFDRVVETQKKGYLTRHNTKVVVASERISHDEPRPLDNIPQLTESSDTLSNLLVPQPNLVQPSPRKISQPTWVAEPWNGKVRRKSIRVGGETSPIKRKPVEGTVPPLPGQASAVQDGLGAVAEDEMAEEEAEDFEDGMERGRLFVKVVGAKDLKLPLPAHERTQFALTLDNGLHCVTTAWMDLAKAAPIGQEFELVVLNELEFQLTLQMKLEPPKLERPVSPTKLPPSPKKQGAFGRFFGSPRKKKESDLKAQLEAQQSAKISPPSAYELVQGLVAKDGSFARAYVSLNEHEKKAYGRVHHTEITCFNEWAMEEVNVGSARSKKSVNQLQRRPPYEIGKLELQLLYVPKPKTAKEEDMPKSMNGAIRAMREAEERAQQQAVIQEFEGHLSQQGGDCPYWRRRFFKLSGSRLTAYHETTLQPRATINLAKATKLIDDKSTLTQRETSTKGGGRRKSAFAEEEEGYMFVEEGFRIRFANGEVIDFYADSPARKDDWMVALSQVVGKGVINVTEQNKGWTEMVLKREKAQEKKTKSVQAPVPVRKSSKEQQTASPTKNVLQSPASPPIPGSSIPLPTRTPPHPRPGMSHARTESYQPNPSSRSQFNSPVKFGMSIEERYRKTKSMIM